MTPLAHYSCPACRREISRDSNENHAPGCMWDGCSFRPTLQLDGTPWTLADGYLHGYEFRASFSGTDVCIDVARHYGDDATPVWISIDTEDRCSECVALDVAMLAEVLRIRGYVVHKP